MNTFTFVVFAVAMAAAQAGLITHSVITPLTHGATLQGPSSKTAIYGPDRSHIVGVAPGGAIYTSVDVGYTAHSAHGIVAQAVPAVAAHQQVVTPIVAHQQTFAHSAIPALAAPAVIAQAAPIVAHAAKVVAHQASIVAHPSSIAHAVPIGPVVAHAAPVVVQAAPHVAHTASVAAPHGVAVAPVKTIDPAFVAHGPHGAIITPGTGIEGQYQYDYSDNIYDDGEYKGEFYNEHY